LRQNYINADDSSISLILDLVDQNIHNEDDWRYKNSAISALSQIGEYLGEVDEIANFIPIVISNIKHSHPMVRYSSLHCLGQLSTDLQGQFTQTYHETVIPALIEGLDDPVDRVKAHSVGCLSNFLEASNETIGNNYWETFLPKLISLLKSDSAIVARDAPVWIASTAEWWKEGFIQFYDTVSKNLLEFIEKPLPESFKPAKGRAIEALSK